MHHRATDIFEPFFENLREYMFNPFQSMSLALFLFLFWGVNFSQFSEREEVLRKCTELFGQTLDNDFNLFEVNSYHVLEVKFRDGKLTRFSVSPKYYFESKYPEWEEKEGDRPLTWVEYQNVLARLESIKSKGALVKGPPAVSMVTNNTRPSKQKFKDAILNTGFYVDIFEEAGSPSQIRWFFIDFERIDESQIDLDAEDIDLESLRKSNIPIL
jgi:hypothetical protein